MLIIGQGLATVYQIDTVLQQDIIWHRWIERPSLEAMNHKGHISIVEEDLRYQRRSLGEQTIDLQPLVVEQVTAIFLALPLEGIAGLTAIASDSVQE